ncbi:hypothetical protein BaRGS_00037424 [Batillaria attramentaria]|uniref:Sushi, von Willebrand factor type A, EGF and pentraxin domain-containing protein 1-like n=1 Tax=Batillaria attramentaria TaxID=370345 RepID=A0ABD0J8Y4_9CAEN
MTQFKVTGCEEKNGMLTGTIIETVCPDLPAPQNGALACYLGNYGYNCLMSCNEDYDTNAQTDGKFECTNSNGFWFPSNVPDCTEYLRPSDVRLHADVFYYAGNCDTSLDELRQNFIDRINNSTWKDACINVLLCTAENVEVTCGAISGRRKRNANENSERVRRQTQTDDFYVQFDFDIVITYDEGSKTREETYQDFKAMLAIVQTNLRADADAGDFDFLGLETYEYSVGYPTLHADCPPGTFFKKWDTTQYISCRGCGSGFYVTEGSTQCEACPVGSYTELDNATSCTPCPPGWSTPTTGSRNSFDCKAADVSLNGTTLSAFLNGQWSSLTSTAWISLETGALTLVEFDFDVDDYVPFSVNLYTSAADASLLSTDSATSASVLVEPDTWSRLLLIVDLETATTTVYHQDTILLAFTQTLFTSQPSATLNISVLEGKAIVGGLYAVDRVLTESEISASLTTCAGNNTDNILTWSPQAASLQIPSLCDAVDECREQPCGDFACVNGRGTFECHCEDGWSGDTCNEPPDPCQEHDCQNGATCVPGNTFTTYTCLCGDEFSGTLCSLIKVQGAWSEWTSWGQCSASCQGGERTRTRTCDNPSPQFGGGDCDGPSIEVEACNADACPVHGGYGEWSEWPPCSVTCGGGQTIRNRTCNNPAPANGGNACSGPPSETEVCNEEQCPECAELVLSQGTLPLACNETNNPYLKSCRLECAQGYSSLFEFPLYTCGEETAYLWNHQRDASLVPPLPGCERPKTIMYASATQHVKMNAGCDESTDSIVLSGVESNIKSIPCVQQKVCSAQVQSSCVQAETGRKKRSTDSLQITVQVTVDFGPSQTYADNDTSLAEYDGLMEVAVESADTAFANDTEALFTVVAGNQSFTPDVASISYSISTQCPAGSVPYEAFCLDCPMGYKEVNGECVPCPLGQYQDESGSTQCKPCPDGLSWDVMAALSSDQCILTFIIDDADMPDDDSDIPGEEKQKADSALPIIVGVTCAVVVAVAAFLAMIAIYKCQRRKGTKGQRYKGKPRPLSACSRRVSPAPWHDHDVPMKVSPPLYSELPPVSPRDLHFEQTGHGAMPVKKNSLASVGTVEA